MAKHSALKGRRRFVGVTLLEVAMGLGLMSMGLVAGGRAMNESAQASRALSAASRLSEVSAAATDYVRTNRQTLATLTTPGGQPISIPAGRTAAGGAVPTGPSGLASLQGGGFLSANFIDQNNYGQRHRLLVRQRTDGTLEFMVTQVGGRTIPDQDLSRVTQRMGATGGAALARPPSGIPPNVIVGTVGGWRSTVAEWTAADGLGPTVGRAAVSNAYSQATGMADYLYRNDIGNPEANRMRTTLDMGSQNITNGGTINSQQSVMQNGGRACAGNATGCTFWIADDGGFRDNNDGWITLVGGGGATSSSRGLAIRGPGAAGLDVLNDARIGQDLFANRDAIVGRNLRVTGNTDITGNVNISGTTYSQGSIVSGYQIIGMHNVGTMKDLIAGERLSVGGNASFQGDINALGNLQIMQNTHLRGTLRAERDVQFDQNASVSGGLWANYIASNGNMNVGNDLGVGGAVYAGYLNSGTNLDVANTATIGNNLGVGRGGIYSQGRITGEGGLRTIANASPGEGCDQGMIAVNAGTGGMLYCRQGAYVVPGAPRLAERFVVHLTPGTHQLNCPANSVPVGWYYEGLTWTNTMDDHSGPEIYAAMCAPVD